MYANGCYWRADQLKITSGLLGSEKQGVFPDPGIRILPLDRMVGDEFGVFSGGRCLRREGAHPMTVLCYPELLKVAEKGEFRHTDLGSCHFEGI